MVCTGNTCRSPMAAALLSDAAARASVDLTVRSAGLAAFPGVPYTPEAVEALREIGLDLSGGVSRPLQKDWALEADVVLTMTPEQRDAILRKLPGLAGKVFLLADFAGEGEVPVGDPVGKPLEEYRRVRDQLARYARRAAERLRD